MGHRLGTEQVLEITLGEMQQIGAGWRVDWSGFDGRYLRSQLDDLAKWANQAARDETRVEYTAGTNFHKEQICD